jgi:outer membrane protein OmpU
MRETMKNLLLASTALVAFAGAAAAEVTVTGQGRFGVVASNGTDSYSVDVNGNLVNNEDGAEVEFSSRLRVIFGMSFESDSGLTFGGTTRADNAAGANDGTAGSVFVSGDFGKLQVGDVDSAAEASVGNISGVGYTGIGDYNETFYLLSGGGDPLANDQFSATAFPAALYSFSTGGATFYLGIGNPAGRDFVISGGTVLPDGTTVAGQGECDPVVAQVDPDYVNSQNLSGLVNDTCTTIGVSQQYSVGVNWSNDQFSVGAGYESTKVENIPSNYSATWGAFYIGGSATFGGATVKAMYGDITDLDYSQYGMSVDYTFDAWTATAFFRTSDYGNNVIAGTTDSDRTAYGFGATYDLGGGVEVKGGVVDPDLPDVYYQADLGVTFNF